MKVCDYQGRILKEDTASKQQKFLYETLVGRLILKPLTMRFFSRFGGFIMNRKISKLYIKGFVKKHQIDLSLYEQKKFKSYNDFFTRKKIGVTFNPNPDTFISPCDAKLSVYPIQKDSLFFIKQSAYHVSDLLHSSEEAKRYQDGYCLIFRLDVEDYHRYIYIDDGYKGADHYVKGKFHTVNPIALRKNNIYKQNARSISYLHTKHFGKIAHVEVGALMVGRIHNHYQYHCFNKGEEKGMFLFGGSTIVLLVEKNQISIDPTYLNHSSNNMETVVKIGQEIGRRSKHDESSN